MDGPRSGRPPCRGFSLIELVIVVVVIGVIAGIAIPRFGAAAQSSQSSALLASTRQFQTALDHYYEEHGQRGPAIDPDGTRTNDAETFARRLLEQTAEDGSLIGPLGPYLRAIPVNPMNRLNTVRIGATASGANTHGWRYVPSTNLVTPDDTAGFNLWKRSAQGEAVAAAERDDVQVDVGGPTGVDSMSIPADLSAGVGDLSGQ